MKSKEVKNKLHIDSQVRTLSLKFYEEQLPNGEEVFIKGIKAIDKKTYQVVAILHNADSVKNDDDPFEVSSVKPHWHLYLRVMSNKHKPRIKQLLKLLGVEYRPTLDKDLWNNHGVETCKDFVTCVTYGLHKTTQAQEDGKHEYDITEYVSNLTIEEIEQVMQGYKRLEDETKRPSNKTLTELAETAWKLGYDLKDFEDWKDQLPFNIQRHSAMKEIEKRYSRGVEKRIEENSHIVRLAIFIQGGHGVGKSYNAEIALKGLGLKTILIGGQATGKYDDIKPTIDALIVDDDTAPHLLNLADNKMLKVYRRNKNNPYWCGSIIVVTSNKTFEEWATDCKVAPKNMEAAKSRFYMCEVGICNEGYNVLYCDRPSTRGTYEDQEQRLEMFKKFRDAFNTSIKEYVPDKRKVDYSKLNANLREATAKEKASYANVQQQRMMEWYFKQTLRNMSYDELKKRKQQIEEEDEKEDVDGMFAIN